MKEPHFDSFHDHAEKITEVFAWPGMTREDVVSKLADKWVVGLVRWWLTHQCRFSGFDPCVHGIPAELLELIAGLLITGMAAQYELDAGKVPAIEAAELAEIKAEIKAEVEAERRLGGETSNK